MHQADRAVLARVREQHGQEVLVTFESGFIAAGRHQVDGLGDRAHRGDLDRVHVREAEQLGPVGVRERQMPAPGRPQQRLFHRVGLRRLLQHVGDAGHAIAPAGDQDQRAHQDRHQRQQDPGRPGIGLVATSEGVRLLGKLRLLRDDRFLGSGVRPDRRRNGLGREQDRSLDERGGRDVVHRVVDRLGIHDRDLTVERPVAPCPGVLRLEARAGHRGRGLALGVAPPGAGTCGLRRAVGQVHGDVRLLGRSGPSGADELP